MSRNLAGRYWALAVLAFVVAPFLLVGSSACWLFEEEDTGLGRGSPAPAFSLTDIKGGAVTSASLKGRPVFLHFFSRPDASTAKDMADIAAGVTRWGGPRGIRQRGRE